MENTISKKSICSPIVRTYVCWNRLCDNKKRINETNLIKRVEENGKHIDLCCPKCEKVIVCITNQDLNIQDNNPNY